MLDKINLIIVVKNSFKKDILEAHWDALFGTTEWCQQLIHLKLIQGTSPYITGIIKNKVPVKSFRKFSQTLFPKWINNFYHTYQHSCNTLTEFAKKLFLKNYIHYTSMKSIIESLSLKWRYHTNGHQSSFDLTQNPTSVLSPVPFNQTSSRIFAEFMKTFLPILVNYTLLMLKSLQNTTASSDI